MTPIHQRSRLAMAFAAGVLVVATMTWTCYVTYPWPSVDTPWNSSRSSLRKWQFALEEYKRKHGQYPDQLFASANSDIQPFDEKDGWGFPFHYRKNDEAYELRCLGSDGQPGGTGLRGDIGPDDTMAELPRPSLSEFVQKDFQPLMAMGCAAAGLFACLMILKKTGTTTSSSVTSGPFLFTLVATTLTSFLIGFGLILFHMASQH